MPGLDRFGLSSIVQGYGAQLCRRIEEQLDIGKELRLILLDDQQIVTSGRHHLLAQGPLAVQGIARQDPSRPGDALDQLRSNRQFRLGAIGLPYRVDRVLCQDDPRPMADGAYGMDRTARVAKWQAAPVRLAVDGNPGERRLPRLGNRRYEGAQRVTQRLAIEFGKKALYGRLVGSGRIGKAQGGPHFCGLPSDPLTDGQHRLLTGEDRRHRHG